MPAAGGLNAGSYSATYSASPRTPIFFIEDWHQTYSGFQARCLRRYRDGYRWIARSTLAAFYDTISRDFLINRVSPRGGSRRIWDRVRGWLPHLVRVGPPRLLPAPASLAGPMASDFLAKIAFLLPLDEAMMQQRIRYVRYVDDIRLFGRTLLEAQDVALKLDVACRNLGLISIHKVLSLEEATSLARCSAFCPVCRRLSTPNPAHPFRNLAKPSRSWPSSQGHSRAGRLGLSTNRRRDMSCTARHAPAGYSRVSCVSCLDTPSTSTRLRSTCPTTRGAFPRSGLSSRPLLGQSVPVSPWRALAYPGRIAPDEDRLRMIRARPRRLPKTRCPVDARVGSPFPSLSHVPTSSSVHTHVS